MGERGCGFGIMVMAILFVMLVTFGAVLASIGIAPIANSAGLSWDSSAYIAKQQAETTRYIAQQQADTERSRQINDTLQILAIVGCVAGVLVVGIVQYNRTRRQQQVVQLKLQAYLAYLGVNGEVGKYHGQLGVYDHDHGEFVPAGVALIEMREN